MKDLISVIINVYNGEKFINKCLDCIINQTYKNLEILVINDGSTDNTLSIIKEYKDKRIKVITTENKGLSLSRNVGIDNAKGKYLYFIDVDDFIELDTIEYLYNLIKKYNVDISTCKCVDIYDYNFKIRNKKEKIKVIDSREMLKKILLSTNRTVTIWNKLYKKELFNNLKFENRLMDDLSITHKLAIRSNMIIYSNQIKYYYLRHKNATTAKEIKDIERSIDYYKMTIERYDYINKIYPKLLENKISVLRVITMLYLRNINEVNIFLKKQNALNLFKKFFSLKVLFCNISFNEKIKIILLRINPKLCIYINRKYQSINKKYKM